MERALITVLDSINQTTMPYNEFILYRNSHYLDEKQIVLLTGNEILIPKEDIPSNIEIHVVGKNPFALRKELKKIKNDCETKSIGYTIHLHSIRGSFSTLIAMCGLISTKRSVFTIHSTFPGYRFHNKVLSFLDAYFAHYVTCVSNASYDKFPSFIKRKKGNKILAIQNGVNIERVDSFLCDECNQQEKDEIVRFVYVARMVPLKNHKFLIDILVRIKDSPKNRKIKFVFIGEEEIPDVRSYAIEKGVLDLIEFTGLISREEVYKRLKASDVYISSSTLEGLPVSVLEGMYCGLPCILSDIPQHREVSGNCSSNYILPYNESLWADKILEISNKNKEEIKVFGERCKEFVINYFTLQSMHNAYDKIYKITSSNY